MQITQDELFDIIAEASNRLHVDIRDAYKSGLLEGYLSGIGMEDLIPNKSDERGYESYTDGKILIFGDSMVKDKDILGCVKSLGISKERIEMHLGYTEAKKFNFKNLKYAPNYRLVMFGPVPHSGKGKSEYSSIITQVENEEGFPKVVRLTDGHSLKITKSSLKNALNKELEMGYISP
ncbi:hypothetical protein SH1V18_34370 [Vallitalea longa]|uniref:Uncharacterized protein n=1 Tax=Vallitalea longa TaxID=2936439 RepID=A0A9W5YCH8_9FIRM|nr:hypothetical protein [Vallitalea longa]GKX30957.1 hypothetical protein SH1V18_34370 [Vallitalea longa]